MTRQQQLLRAQESGYLIAPPRYESCLAYRVWCQRQQRPYVHVYVRRRTARGRLDFDTTRNRSDETRACLSERGAETIREWCSKYTPPAKVRGASAGSSLVVITGVPDVDADALGAILYAAATTSPCPQGAVA